MKRVLNRPPRVWFVFRWSVLVALLWATGCKRPPEKVVFFADPPVVYNGITTQVTLYAESITPPLSRVTIRRSGGSDLTLQAVIDPVYPKRVLATVPAGTPAGTYDIAVVDASDATGRLRGGLRVVDQATLSLVSIDPPFGAENSATAVTITAQGGLQATPRVYLSPSTPQAGAVAVALSSVAYVSPTQLTAIVPRGAAAAASPYDLIVVNPDGTVGVLTEPTSALYKSLASPPPVVTNISPGAVPNVAPPAITISGTDFRNPAVVFNCITDLVAGTRTAFPATVSSSTATSILINQPPVTSVPSPSLCTLRVTNDDGSYADFSALAISNSSGNLSPSRATTSLPAPRRAPAVLGADATRAARFLYVIGGDGGSPASALDTVVTTTTNESGVGAEWMTQRYRLNRPRTLAGYAALGRYLYVVGGNDGNGPVATVERAMVLDPLRVPVVRDIDIEPGAGTGLRGGTWNYRVAAVMDANDQDNPGGETLPSELVVIQLPDLTQRLQVTLSWDRIPGAVNYIVYRTPSPNQASGQLEILATVPDQVEAGSTIKYTDTGSATTAGAPLPLGSTGKWRVLADLGTTRESPGVAFGADPDTAGRYYLYATLGRGGATPAALGTYEYLGVTVDPATGQQAVDAAWTAGTQTTTARYQHSIYSVSAGNASYVTGNANYIYLGGGTTDGSQSVGILQASLVQAGGQLGAFQSANPSGIRAFGHAGVTAANFLYVFGSGSPTTTIDAGQLQQGSVPAVGAINANGAALLTARYLPGAALQGALIYIVGGSAVGQSGATDAVEYLIW
ncbi:MAG TPA: hypothetical protein VH877_21365 [Polyangia bacterium]|jgi:hypothetical protein|nr:hypothetical protein [Polyangia bacterium]